MLLNSCTSMKLRERWSPLHAHLLLESSQRNIFEVSKRIWLTLCKYIGTWFLRTNSRRTLLALSIYITTQDWCIIFQHETLCDTKENVCISNMIINSQTHISRLNVFKVRKVNSKSTVRAVCSWPHQLAFAFEEKFFLVWEQHIFFKICGSAFVLENSWLYWFFVR